jgi:hypothetical protein
MQQHHPALFTATPSQCHQLQLSATGAPWGALLSHRSRRYVPECWTPAQPQPAPRTAPDLQHKAISTAQQSTAGSSTELCDWATATQPMMTRACWLGCCKACMPCTTATGFVEMWARLQTCACVHHSFTSTPLVLAVRRLNSKQCKDHTHTAAPTQQRQRQLTIFAAAHHMLVVCCQGTAHAHALMLVPSVACKQLPSLRINEAQPGVQACCQHTQAVVAGCQAGDRVMQVICVHSPHADVKAAHSAVDTASKDGMLQGHHACHIVLQDSKGRGWARM